MITRKKRLIIIQFFLLTFGLLIIFFTYLNKKNFTNEKIISNEAQKKIEKQLSQQSTEGDVFYNIEYSGLDLSGNRYILKSKEALTNPDSKEIINMKSVEAIFYFKDDTVLTLFSDKGIYNNNTLDMTFVGNVKASYQNSQLFAERAEYSNQKSFLTITENVVIDDIKGKMFADKLLFDIKKQQLNISSVKNNKINANISLK
tara:strand:- start:6877 stop:7482 length:606 start_codon:yes stop_codon:yes gene_type:complete